MKGKQNFIILHHGKTICHNFVKIRKDDVQFIPEEIVTIIIYLNRPKNYFGSITV